MASKITAIKLTHGNEAYQTIVDRLLRPSSKVREELVSLRNFFHAAVGGNRDLKAVVEINTGEEVAATGTVTLSSLVAADTITVGTQIFTASASPTGNNQFLVTGGDTLAAAALVVKINAHPSLARVVTATSALGVVTVTSYVAGLIGNQIGIAISAHGSVSGSGKLTSGVNATTYSTSTTYHAGV